MYLHFVEFVSQRCSLVKKCHNSLKKILNSTRLLFLKSPFLGVYWLSLVILIPSLSPSVSLTLPCTLQDMHIISTDEKQVFAAVQEWNQNNTYSLYISDSPGVYFTLSLENLRTSRGPAGNLLVDFYKVCC